MNHPEVGQSGDSVAAVVASMDGMLGQYAAYVTTCASRTEPVTNLQEATSGLLDAFCRRNNGKMPVRIIIYRDGVADNQFQQVRSWRDHVFSLRSMKLIGCAVGVGE